MAYKRGVQATVFWRFLNETNHTNTGSDYRNTNPEYYVTRTGISSGSMTAKVSKDGGTPATSTNSIVEVANGVYRLTLTATEMTADTVIVKPSTTVTSPFAFAYPQIIVLYTEPDWDNKVFGPSFTPQTASLAGLRLGITNAQTPITRDD